MKKYLRFSHVYGHPRMPYTSKMYVQYKNLNHVRFTSESSHDGVEPYSKPAISS
jgi:hypothetical protein